MQKKSLVVVDISSFIFRSYYAIRPLTTPDGVQVNAVYGVFSMLIRLLTELKPSHIVLARDHKKGSFRNDMYEQYKANRSAPPDDLVPQFDLIVKLLEFMNLPNIIREGFEADDLIGSIVMQWKDEFESIIIASGDKDLMQFVGENIWMVDTKVEKKYGVLEVKEKMGVRPDQIVDYLSMVGDSSDNIPGMRGIGAKGASKLLAEFETLDNCIANKDSFKGKKLVGAFSEHLEEGMLSRELVKIVTDIDLKMNFDDVNYHFRNSMGLKSFFEELGFKNHIGRIEKLLDLYGVGEQENVVSNDVSLKANIVNIATEKDFRNCLDRIVGCKEIFYMSDFGEEFDIRNPICVGMMVHLEGGDVYDFQFTGEGILIDETGEMIPGKKCVIGSLLKNLWEHSNTCLYGHNIKKDIIYARVKGIETKSNFFDLQQAHYVLEVGERHDFEFLMSRYLNMQLESFDPLAQAQRVVALRDISVLMREALEKSGMKRIFYEIDNPLVLVLAKMELRGIGINVEYFKTLKEILAKKLTSIEEEISETTGEELNLKSPKQLSNLLFEKMGFPVIKKTKTINSTDSEVLEKLASLNLNSIPGLILQFRELEKLQSTYVSVLPELVNPETKRIHSKLNSTVTMTGRLSSEKPNLQNIPVKSPNGRKVREGFIAEEGWTLLSADYSQIELRLLAHFSKDETMIKAFKDQVDIHTQTASEILNIDIDLVTKEQRSCAKAVNFGLMYGQSSFGLSRLLKISRSEAKNYIEMYFARFGSVKGYLDSLKELCEKKGYAESYFGRRRVIPDIASNNRNVRGGAERMAINTPIQGTAADIIKIAMNAIDHQMDETQMKSRLLLQVHDELIFEVYEGEEESLSKMVREEMKGVCCLSVPLEVNVSMGKNWACLK
ncbi:DNA polymerase I [Bacteriovoracaceae bacterium]|nr:DNA polymerase I [Bacteriovoracaceae bacterium]